MPKNPETAPVVAAAALCSRGLAGTGSSPIKVRTVLRMTNSMALRVESSTTSINALGTFFASCFATASTGIPTAELKRMASEGFSSLA